MEHSPRHLPGGQRVLQLEPLGDAPVAKTVEPGTHPGPKQSNILHAGMSPVPPKPINFINGVSQEGRGVLSPTGLLRKPRLCSFIQNPVLPNNSLSPPQASPAIMGSAQGIRRCRFSDGSQVHPGERINVPSLVVSPLAHNHTAPLNSIVTPSAQPSSSSSSPTVLELVNGRGGHRTFKRMGMHCVANASTHSADGCPEDTGVLMKELHDALAPNINKEGGGIPLLYNIGLRRMPLSSLCVPFNKTSEMEASHPRKSLKVKMLQNAVRGKTRNPDFTGTHRRRGKCPFHQSINEGDVEIAELKHTDSSHYIRSYALTSSTASESVSESNNSNNNSTSNGNRHHNHLEREKPSVGIVSEKLVATAPVQKTGAMLSRTLSEIRSKSKHNTSAPHNGVHRQSNQNYSTSDTNKRRKSASKDNSSSRYVTRIICEKWAANLSSSGSSSSNSSDRGRSPDHDSDDDATSCCSCCSCFLKNDEKLGGGMAVSGSNIEKTPSHCNSTVGVYSVTYNNFFDEEEIPTLSMHDFRRTSGLTCKTMEELDAQTDSQLE